MTCIKISSDESHFNVSLIVREKVTRPCPQTTFLKRKESRSGIEPRSFRLPAYRLTTRPHRLCYQDHATPFLIPVTCTVVSSFEEVEFQSRCCPTDCEKSRLRRYELRSLSLFRLLFKNSAASNYRSCVLGRYYIILFKLSCWWLPIRVLRELNVPSIRCNVASYPKRLTVC